MKHQQVFIAIQSFNLLEQVENMLNCYNVKEFTDSSSLNTIIDYINNNHPILLVLESPWRSDIDTLDIAVKVRQIDRRFPIILVTANGSESLAISALRAGVKDYFSFPIPAHEFHLSIHQCVANYRCQSHHIKHISTSSNITNIQQQLIGESFLIEQLKTYLQKLAVVDSHVLITGETGTGKELTAQYIHQYSKRCNKPFIAINCSAIPDGLLESELFGYEKGAFTGANSAYVGKLKLAEGGTVFLDEIGDMSLYTQAKILRVIESKEVYPLGSKRSVPINIRIIAATNCHLEDLVLKKDFRQDLYFRLNVARIQLPALRDRKEDIEGLVKYYLQIFSKLFEHEILEFTEEVWDVLLHYEWPGNIRELKNFLEALYIDPPLGRVAVKDLPNCICSCHSENHPIINERELLLSTLHSVQWNKSKAADKLHWSRMTLYRKMAKHHISDNES